MSKMITDFEIKSATRRSISSRQRVTLKDPGPRGSGRLALIVRPRDGEATCEWYVVWHRDGGRQTAKLGNYPAMGIKQARTLFQDRYAPEIADGLNPVGPRAVLKGHGQTVRDLFLAYHGSLVAKQKRSAPDVYRLLLGPKGAIHSIGPDRLVRHVEPKHMLPHLEAIHQRGAKGMANNVRAYLKAAFKFGMVAPYSYGQDAVGTDWGLKYNPAALIKPDSDAFEPRERHLSRQEFAAFYNWLADRVPSNEMAAALQLMMLTGQRPDEVMQLGLHSISNEATKLKWAKTKMRPHSIPLVGRTKAIVQSLAPNEHGLFFWRPMAPDQRARVAAPRRLVHEYIAETGCERFTCHDLRRTWKSLAGDAGISKFARDLVQNHKGSDVSSVHYDRYDYHREQLGALEKWDAYVTDMLDEYVPAVGGTTLHFGEYFSFNLPTRELRRNNVRVHVPTGEKVLLALLLENPGRELPIEELVSSCQMRITMSRQEPSNSA